ncbi:radical SAM protein [Treponema sp. TIM-1]|uniref:B12-binding domain-containing radical SAM protein n=1 Tax=Treponema sp. TIM-1 TaxID=2898417 RepID=UPI00397FB9AA
MSRKNGAPVPWTFLAVWASPVSLDILLTTINAKWIHPSLALRLLKANLGQLENRAEILEFAQRQPLTEKTEPILSAAPRILGISVSIWNHQGTVELLRALEKSWNPRAVRPVIVLGGPEVSYLPAGAEIIRRADWVIRGEGEDVFRELCGLLLDRAGDRTDRDAHGTLEGLIRALPPVRGVGGKIVEARPVDLAAIDPGYRLYTKEDLSRKLVYVEASRGCPFGCEFCQSSVPVGGDRTVREFPLDAFLGEMAALINRGGRGFKFLDRSFNLDTNRARQIMEFFLERLQPSAPVDSPLAGQHGAAPRPGPDYVHFEMVPSRFPVELRETLTRFPPGSLRLEIGIQTFNQATSRLINRPGDPEQELEVLGFLREKTQAIVHADLIAGLPGEGLDSFARGFDRLWQVRPAEIQVGILKGLPGTPILRHNGPHNMVYAPHPPYEVQASAALSGPDLDRIRNFARFWELIVNRGAFDDLVPALLPDGEPVFWRFLALSDRLLERFGRNWGIDRRELRSALEADETISKEI